MYSPAKISRNYYIFSNGVKDNLDIVDNSDIWFEVKGRIDTP